MTYALQAILTFANQADADAMKASVDALIGVKATSKNISRVVALFPNIIAKNDRKTFELNAVFTSKADRDTVASGLTTALDASTKDKIVASQNFVKKYDLETSSGIADCIVADSYSKEAVK